MYIYKITNNLNNKIYIGLKTSSVEESESYYGSGVLINLAIDKYGIDNFTKTILERDITDFKVLCERERHYIEYYDSFRGKHGYNMTGGGAGYQQPTKPQQYKPIYQYSPEGQLIKEYESILDACDSIGCRNIYRRKERNKRPIKGYWFSLETLTIDEVQKLHSDYLEHRKMKFVNAAIKRYKDPEYKKGRQDHMCRIRKLAKDHSVSEETKQKISEGLKAYYKNK